MSNKVENFLEKLIFSSRWLMAPIYIGLIGGIILLLISFMQELAHLFAILPNASQSEIILGVLSLIDLSLAGNLLLIVIFSGYENFVSKINTDEHEDNPEWKGNVNFSALKLKLIASIVAISGIHLLKVFMDIAKYDENHIKLQIVIHMVFVVSGVLLALMDYITVKSKK